MNGDFIPWSTQDFSPSVPVLSRACLLVHLFMIGGPWTQISEVNILSFAAFEHLCAATSVSFQCGMQWNKQMRKRTLFGEAGPAGSSKRLVVISAALPPRLRQLGWRHYVYGNHTCQSSDNFQFAPVTSPFGLWATALKPWVWQRVDLGRMRIADFSHFCIGFTL